VLHINVIIDVDTGYQCYQNIRTLLMLCPFKLSIHIYERT